MHSISMLWNVLQPHTKYHERDKEYTQNSASVTVFYFILFGRRFNLSLFNNVALQKNRMVKHNESSLTLKFMSIIKEFFLKVDMGMP